MTISGFDWDEGNLAKCQKHGMTVEEVESIFHGTFNFLLNQRHTAEEYRYQAIGKTSGGRYAFVVFTFRNRDKMLMIRPISARFMHQKEIDSYEKDTR